MNKKNRVAWKEVWDFPTGEDMDQPVCVLSMIVNTGAPLSKTFISWGHLQTTAIDQTARMRDLIWVVADCKCYEKVFFSFQTPFIPLLSTLNLSVCWRSLLWVNSFKGKKIALSSVRFSTWIITNYYHHLISSAMVSKSSDLQE